MPPSMPPWQGYYSADCDSFSKITKPRTRVFDCAQTINVPCESTMTQIRKSATKMLFGIKSAITVKSLSEAPILRSGWVCHSPK